VPPDATALTVPLSLSEMEGVVGCSVVLGYDPRYLTITDVRGVGPAADFSVIINLESPGIVRLTGLDLDLNGLPAGSGAVMEMDIAVGDLPHSSDVSIVRADVYDVDAHQVPVEPEAGTILERRRPRKSRGQSQQ
jgi:hypothetical protein